MIISYNFQYNCYIQFVLHYSYIVEWEIVTNNYVIISSNLLDIK